MPPVTTAIRFVILSIRDHNICEDHEYPMAIQHTRPLFRHNACPPPAKQEVMDSALSELRGFLLAYGIARMNLGLARVPLDLT
jgi:hypothetical protein